MPFIIPAGGARDGYRVARSLRFNSNDFTYLTRTPGVAGNRDVMTFHCWVKLTVTGINRTIFSSRVNINNYSAILFGSGHELSIKTVTAGSTVFYAGSVAVFRDPAAWFALTVSIDTTTSSYRAWVNETELTWGFTIIPAAGTDTWFNNTGIHDIGRSVDAANEFAGYVTHLHFIDGLALDYTSFLVQDPATGVWGPKAYTGAYGTNGFKLDFADNSAATAGALGKDTSGNGNNYTPNNFSVAAGAGNDSVVDSPTNYGTDTGAGGEVRGNYCTWNSLYASGGGLVSMTLTNGNLTANRTSGTAYAEGTFVTPSGKWYYEGTLTVSPGPPDASIGLGYNTITIVNTYNNGGGVIKNGSYIGVVGATYTTGDVIGVAWDVDAGTISYYKNGALQTTQTAIEMNIARPLVRITFANGQWDVNFGQRAFVHTPPAGYKALCTQNLAVPAIKRSDNYITVNARTGTGAAFNVTGKRFSPDLVWTKSRSATTDHAWYDAVRGVQKQIESNTTTAETTEATGLTAFNSDGFSGDALAQINTSAATYLDWLWKKGAVPGIDIVSYTGNGANRTVAHGLGAVPRMIICKELSAGNDWALYHANTESTPSASYYWMFNSTTNAISDNTAWNNTIPTSSVFSLGTSTTTNRTGASFIAYLFADVYGFSKFGRYLGDSAVSDGPFVNTDFRPRWLMVKRRAVAAWGIFDTTHSPLNPAIVTLSPNSNAAVAAASVDIVSNGFKPRDALSNTTGFYIYAAFAEQPFKYARAR